MDEVARNENTGRERGGCRSNRRRGGERPGEATHLHLRLILSTPFTIKSSTSFENV